MRPCPACDAIGLCALGCPIPLMARERTEITHAEAPRVRRQMLTEYDHALASLPTRIAVRDSGPDWSAASAVGGAGAFFSRLAEVEADNVDAAISAALGE